MAETRKRQVGRRASRSSDREAVTPKGSKPSSSSAKRVKEQRLEELARGIDTRLVEIELRNKEMAGMHTEAAELMAELKLEKFDVPRVGEHLFVKKKASDKSTIDPRAYYGKVGKDDFYASVSVTKKNAKEHLPEKVIDQISTKVVGEWTGPHYSFKAAGSKKGK